MSVLASDNGLIFIWESPRRRKLIITGFLFASLVGHAFCFYMFQIIYQPAVALLPPPARVNVIAANTDEGRTLLRWVEAEDPALASMTQRPPNAKAFELPKLEHVPSYLNAPPALKGLPPVVPDLRLASSQPPGPVPIARARKTPERVALETSVSFSGELASIGVLQKPNIKWSALNHETPQSARFRVAVSDHGLLGYCFLQTSSGDATLDEQAKKYLGFCRFNKSSSKDSPQENHFTWGVATVEWGNDIAFPTSSLTEALPGDSR